MKSLKKYIKLNCPVSEGEIIYIRINDEIREIYSLEPSAVFELDEKKEYVIEIERKCDISNRKLINILIFIITILFQGLFNILFLNIDADWIKKVTPYGIKVRVAIDLKQDTEINLKYIKSEYINNNFKKPKLTTDIGEIVSMDYIQNTADFKNQYFNFAKRVLSVLSVGLALFVFLLIIAFKHSIMFGVVFISLIIVGFISVSAVNLKVQYSKLKKFLIDFSKLRQ